MATVRYAVRIKPREIEMTRRGKKVKRKVPRPGNMCFYNGKIFTEGEIVDLPDTADPPEEYFTKIKVLGEKENPELSKEDQKAIEGIKALQKDYGLTDEFLAGIFGEAGATSPVDQHKYLQGFIKDNSLEKA